MAPITLLIIGCGSRGKTYAKFAEDAPDRAQLVGCAEPRTQRMHEFADAYGVAPDRRFGCWKEAAALPKMADAVVIATPDQVHTGPALAFAKLGYHILLEKPMAVNEEECVAIVRACEEHHVMLAVCHVLRYAPHVQKIRDVIKSGRIGEVVNIQHLEPVGYWHFAHSFVRGNWRNERESTFTLMSKCCHDMDLLAFWMDGVKVTSVASMGSLLHFHHSKKPPTATARCLDCPVASECPYDATRLYMGYQKKGVKGWPIDVISDEPTEEGVMRALREGPYGKCVYQTDNDVCDNQVVLLEYENGATASLSMVATTEHLCERKTKVFGSKGEITCNDINEVRVRDFVTNTTDVIDCRPKLDGSTLQGHGGADYFIMHNFIRAVAENDPSLILTAPRATLFSHRLVFGAERARKEKAVVDMTRLEW